LPNPEKYWPPFTTLTEPPFTNEEQLAGFREWEQKMERKPSRSASQVSNINPDHKTGLLNLSNHTSYQDFDSVFFYNPDMSQVEGNMLHVPKRIHASFSPKHSQDNIIIEEDERILEKKPPKKNSTCGFCGSNEDEKDKEDSSCNIF